MRNQIVPKIDTALKQISKASGYNTDFEKVSYWQNTATEYKQNHLDYRDVREEYAKNNSLYKADLIFEVTAIVIEQDDTTAARLGNLALEDLIKAMRSISWQGYFLYLKRSHKYVETKGKTACCIELEFVISYKF